MLRTEGKTTEALKLQMDSDRVLQDAANLRMDAQIRTKMRTQYAKGKINLATTLKYLRKFDHAEDAYRKALTAYRTLQKENPHLKTVTLGIMAAMTNFGSLLRTRGKHREAEGLWREQMTLGYQTLKADPANTLVHKATAVSASMLGGMLLDEKKNTQAIEVYRVSKRSYDVLKLRQPRDLGRRIEGVGVTGSPDNSAAISTKLLPSMIFSAA